MTEEKAKEICKQFVEENKTRPIVLHEAIETILAESEKKDKIIDEMAQKLIDENIKARKDKEEIFKRDNAENESFNLIYSDRYMKNLGYELGISKSVDILNNILKGR